MYAGREEVLEVAHMVAHVPRGGAMSEWVGGWVSVTDEGEALRHIEYAIVATNSKRKPKRPNPPEGVRDQQRKSDRAALMAKRYRKKRGERG